MIIEKIILVEKTNKIMGKMFFFSLDSCNVLVFLWKTIFFFNKKHNSVNKN